jgi:effector-binding domain-containing protein
MEPRPPMISLLEVLAPLAAGAVLLSSILCAQSPPRAGTAAKSDPQLDALLAKLATSRALAVPGKPATLQLSGTYAVTFGESAQPVAKGVFRELFAGTDRARSTTDMGPLGTMERGIAGDTVWEIDPHLGAKVHRGGHAAATRRLFAVLRGDDPRRLYTAIERAGTAADGERELTLLRMTPATGSADTWHVAADGTLVRVDIALPVPESADAAFGLDDLMPASITFGEWRDVDGGRVPMQRTLVMGPAKVTTTFDEAIVGAPIDDARFAPPPAVAKVRPQAVEPAFGADGKPNHQVIERTAQPVASIRTKIKCDDISVALSELLPEVFEHIKAVGGKPIGPPFARYHALSDTEIDIEAGLPVQAPIEAKGRVANSELPGGRIATCWHVGPYEKLTEAHTGLQAWLAARKLTARGGAWEVYWTDPGMVADKAKYRTQLFAPVQ